MVFSGYFYGCHSPLPGLGDLYACHSLLPGLDVEVVSRAGVLIIMDRRSENHGKDLQFCQPVLKQREGSRRGGGEKGRERREVESEKERERRGGKGRDGFTR